MPPAAPPVEIRELVLPMLANHHGTLFAGQGLQLMAKVAFMAARSLARQEVVMAAARDINFLSPIPIGHVLTLRGQVVRLGRSSMTVQVTGLAEKAGAPAESVLGGEFELVAIDAEGRPSPIEP